MIKYELRSLNNYSNDMCNLSYFMEFHQDNYPVYSMK